MIEMTPWITIVILIAICVISYIGFTNARFLEDFRHYPYLESRDRSYYRWITCTFVHANYIHLLLNAFVLYQFGFVVEKLYQSKYGETIGMGVYLFIYIGIAVLSSIPTYRKHKENPRYASIGASGVISGILFIYILYFPTAMLSVWFVPMPAFVLGILYLVYSKWAAINRHEGIDHEAHYWGAVIGLVVGIALDPSVIIQYTNMLSI